MLSLQERRSVAVMMALQNAAIQSPQWIWALMYANVFCCIRYCNFQNFINTILSCIQMLYFRSLITLPIYVTFILWNIIVSNFILLWNQSYILYGNCNFVLIFLWHSSYTRYGVITTRPFKNKEDLLSLVLTSEKF